MTRVVNLYKDPYDVYIGRPGRNQSGPFGNPYTIGPDGDRDEVLRKFRDYFYERLRVDSIFWGQVSSLQGKTLGCFCKPQDCHGDIIAEYVDGGLA